MDYFPIEKMGEVYVYQTRDITQEPFMSIPCREGTQLTDVLEELASGYSPIKSETFSTI